jgi:hypothetical protein
MGAISPRARPPPACGTLIVRVALRMLTRQTNVSLRPRPDLSEQQVGPSVCKIGIFTSTFTS